MSNTMTLRIDAATRTAETEGLGFLVLGDSVRVQLLGAAGADAAGLEAYLWPKQDPDPEHPFAYSPNFATLPKTPGGFSATLLIDSAALRTALTAVSPGTAVAMRLFVYDTATKFTYLDMDVDVRPNPVLMGTAVPDTLDPYVTQSQLATIVAFLAEGVSLPEMVIAKSSIATLVSRVQSLPRDNTSELEAAFVALLAGLAELSAP